MNADLIDQAASILVSARSGRERFGGFPEICRPSSEAVAYQVQGRLHEMLEAKGQGGFVAHKIGCTTDIMQRYLGIPNPCAGGIFSPTLHHENGQFRHGDFCHVGVECEIAVLLGDDLVQAALPYDRETVATAVDACMAAIEIVDDRYVDFSKLDTPTLIADDFFNAGAVLGPRIQDWRHLDLAGLKGRMSINGKVFGPGLGADILGHPLNALAWLANALNARGRFLRSGEIVLLGSVVQTHWLDAGDMVEVEIENLGKVRANFT